MVSANTVASPKTPKIQGLTVFDFSTPAALQEIAAAAAANKPNKQVHSWSWLTYLLSVRFRMCLLLCGAMFIMQFMNMSLGMTIICMVRQNMTVPLELHEKAMMAAAEQEPNETEDVREHQDLFVEHMSHLNNISDHHHPIGHSHYRRHQQPFYRPIPKHCPHHLHTNRFRTEGKYDWSPMVQGLVLSSLSWGRLLTPAAGLLSDRFNVKILMSIGIALAGMSTALIPISSDVDYTLVIVWRLITGLADAIVQPSTNRLLPIWFPMDERNLALSITTGGRQLAVVSVYPLAGYLCEKENLGGSGMGGWPLVFYFAAALALIWLPLWIFWANQNPQKHRNIGNCEKKTIESGTGAVLGTKDCRGRIPWRPMLKSTALWANIGAVLCHEVPLVIVFVFLPSYMRDVLHFDIKDIGILSGLPAAAFLITKLLSSQMADCLQRGCGKLSKTTIAKIFNSIASAGLGACLIVISSQNCTHRMFALVIMITAISFAGLHTPGCLNCLVTIAPSFAGTISSLAFFLIASAALINPIAVKAIVKTGSFEEWSIVFRTAGGIALCPLLFFNIWGSAQEQPWGKVESSCPPSCKDLHDLDVESLAVVQPAAKIELPKLAKSPQNGAKPGEPEVAIETKS